MSRVLRAAKFATIWFLDWVVDVRILRHRFQPYCAWVAHHPWWDTRWEEIAAAEEPKP